MMLLIILCQTMIVEDEESFSMKSSATQLAQ